MRHAGEAIDEAPDSELRLQEHGTESAFRFQPPASVRSPGKVGVLTFHRCINYGSYWQARCLVEGLRASGMDAVLLDHHCNWVNRTEWRCAFQPLLPARVPRADLPLYGAKVRRFLDAFEQLPCSPPFPLGKGEEAGCYEMIVVGSDEVWNLQHPWYGRQPLFYGAGLSTDRLVSYAASFGSQHASNPIDEWWTAWLQRFSSISVRDENSREMIRNALGIEPELVLDPCLQFSEVIPFRGSSGERPYVAIYGHNFPTWFVEHSRAWAARRGLPLVSIGYRNDWADEQRIDAGPEEFARLIAESSAVLSNFFHGCVFALLNGKPFAAALSDYRSNKLIGLTDALGAQQHLLDEGASPSAFAEILNQPLQPHIEVRLAELRGRSAAYLDHALA
jgi:hypothetical protein